MDVEQLKQPLQKDSELTALQNRLQKHEAREQEAVNRIDTGYGGLKSHVEKSVVLFAKPEANRCFICKAKLSEETLSTTCPSDGCQTMIHVGCLAKRFVEQEGFGHVVLPTSGRCPQCESELQWIDLMKETSLRTRSHKDLARLMKKSRKQVSEMPTACHLKSQRPVEIQNDCRDSETDLCEISEAFVDNFQSAYSDDDLPDDWHRLSDVDDNISATSVESHASNRIDNQVGQGFRANRLKAVIEDSDWDEAETLD